MNFQLTYLLIGVSSFAIALLVAWLFSRSSYARLRFYNARLEDENSKIEPLRLENENLKIENAALKRDREANLDKLKWIESAEEKLREAFDSLALKALKDNSAQFLNHSKEQIESLVKIMKGDWNTQRVEFKNIVGPIEKDLEKLDKQVKDMEEKREGAYQSLEKHISFLNQAHNDLYTATIQLSQALKSSSDRAKWGEVQLRRIAEMAGMVEHVDFIEQKSTETGTGIPDMVVKLPNKGIIPVDSKAPMNSYLSACEAETEEKRNEFLMLHAKALKGHINSLSKKAYWSQFDISPEFVVMLIPYESGLSAAFSSEPTLLEYALNNKVIIVSPATLLALLKVIALGWMQLQLAKNAQEIANQGKELLDRLKVFSGHFSDVGSRLGSSVESYNKAVGSMESRVLPSVKKLKELGAGSEDVKVSGQIDVQARIPREVENE